VLAGCGKAELPSIPPNLDVWARTILAMPVGDVCDAPAAGYFCRVREALVPAEVRAVGMHTISLEGLGHDEHYIDMDWGGGHIEAYGVIVWPAGSPHVADVERGERKLRDGVFRYDTRQ
jgi:hypothetical protein